MEEGNLKNVSKYKALCNIFSQASFLWLGVSLHFQPKNVSDKVIT